MAYNDPTKGKSMNETCIWKAVVIDTFLTILTAGLWMLIVLLKFILSH